MGKSDSVVDFAMKFTHIISDLRNLGEAMEEKEVVRRFLRATPAKFVALTLSLELDKVSLDEGESRQGESRRSNRIAHRSRVAAQRT